MVMQRNRLLLRFAGVAALAAVTSLGFAPRMPALAAPTNSPGVAPVAPGMAPLAPGMARIWIYRDYEPFQSLARPYVRLNGAIAAISEPGGAFYRDVAPGTYAVTVDSDGTDTNQFASVPVAAGQQVYVKVLVSKDWASGGGGDRGGGAWQRNTFYTWQIQPEIAAAAIARMPLYAGG